MNDQDYIKAGVELADGWEWNHGGAFCDDIARDLLFGRDRVELKRWMLAALVDQLTDQVDALFDIDFDCHKARSYLRKWTGLHREEFTSAGQDRLMNSIKAIVDSKVLEVKK